MNTIKVRITGAGRSYLWYNDRIGDVFVVNAEPEEHGAKLWRITEGDKRSGGIWCEDAEVVVEEPRMYLHDGKEYKLPEWAKHVTCDGEGRDLFAWEKLPMWHRHHGYMEEDGRRERLKEYVEPLPKGAFIEAV